MANPNFTASPPARTSKTKKLPSCHTRPDFVVPELFLHNFCVLLLSLVFTYFLSWSTYFQYVYVICLGVLKNGAKYHFCMSKSTGDTLSMSFSAPLSAFLFHAFSLLSHFLLLAPLCAKR